MRPTSPHQIEVDVHAVVAEVCGKEVKEVRSQTIIPKDNIGEVESGLGKKWGEVVKIPPPLCTVLMVAEHFRRP